MDWSTKFFTDWNAAKVKRNSLQIKNMEAVICHSHRWVPPVVDWIKLNVDASFWNDSDKISIGMILRIYMGMFVTGK